MPRAVSSRCSPSPKRCCAAPAPDHSTMKSSWPRPTRRRHPLIDVVGQLAAEGTTMIVRRAIGQRRRHHRERAVFTATWPSPGRLARPPASRRPQRPCGWCFFRSASTPTHPRSPTAHSRCRRIPALEVDDITMRFGHVLDTASLRVAAPMQILGVIGSNGAGKAPLFDVCMGSSHHQRPHPPRGPRRYRDPPRGGARPWSAWLAVLPRRSPVPIPHETYRDHHLALCSQPVTSQSATPSPAHSARRRRRVIRGSRA